MQRNPRAKKVMIALAGGALVGLTTGVSAPVLASTTRNPCAPKTSKMMGHPACKNPCAAKRAGKMGGVEKNPCQAKKMDRKRGMGGQGSSSGM